MNDIELAGASGALVVNCAFYFERRALTLVLTQGL